MLRLLANQALAFPGVTWGRLAPMHPELKETLIRARLGELGFDLERDPGGLDWIVRDRRERNEFMRALPATRCQELDTVIEFFGLEL
jgi:hypothetical protein